MWISELRAQIAARKAAEKAAEPRMKPKPKPKPYVPSKPPLTEAEIAAILDGWSKPDSRGAT